MDTIELTPVEKPLRAVVTIPGSKSLTNRAFIAAALADGTSTLNGILLADDTHHMVNALRSFGIRVEVIVDDERAFVTGCGGMIPAGEADIFCGNAGTVMRFGAALAALGQGKYRFDGIPRMRERPIGGLVHALQALGGLVEHVGEDGYPPMVVHARGLRGGTVTFDSPPSSQLISAVLLAAPYARSDVFIDIRGQVVSQPYIRMTQRVMADFGVTVIEENMRKFIVAAPQRYKATEYTIEPDASNATYFLAAPAVAGGHVTVRNLSSASVQGDAAFVDVLESMGCRIDRDPDSLTVHGPTKEQPLQGVDVDLNPMPDTAQTLAVVALFAEGPTRIRNVANLRVKETDRLAALATELRKLGAKVDEAKDGLTIHPPDRIIPASIDTYDDHRMAMSFALAGLVCEGIAIRDPGCTSKTFPDFFDRFAQLARFAE